jgi:hypothetical protein
VKRLALVAALFVAAPAWAAGPDASAPVVAPAPAQTANAEILVIHATKEAGKGWIDERIQLPHLSKKPFSDYNTFKVVDKRVLPLQKGTPASYALPTGRTLRVTLKDVTKDKRYAVDSAIDQPGKEEYLKLLEVVAAPNEPFFVGGQSYRGGTLILAITMRP